MDAECCVEGTSQNELHSEAVQLATLAGELLILSLVHKPRCLELLDLVFHSVAIQSEAVFHPGDPGHNSLHVAAGSGLLQAVCSHFARAFAAELRFQGHAVASGPNGTAGKIAEEVLETAKWSFAVFDHQTVSSACQQCHRTTKLQ